MQRGRPAGRGRHSALLDILSAGSQLAKRVNESQKKKAKKKNKMKEKRGRQSDFVVLVVAVIVAIVFYCRWRIC